jgi:protein-tyrosine phosphatase
MGFAIVFLLLGGLFTWLGFIQGHGPVGTIASIGFFWAATAEFFTGSCYLANSVAGVNPGKFFKTKTGRIIVWPRFLTWPYLWFEWRTWRRYLKKAKEPRYEKVADGLYLGARVTNDQVKTLRADGIVAILDLVAEFSAPPRLFEAPAFDYLTIPTLDGSSPTLSELTKAADFIASCHQAGKPVLVHCTFGHGRSAMALAAGLIRTGLAKDPAQAIAILQKCRRRIWLTREQKRTLGRYAESIEN